MVFSDFTSSNIQFIKHNTYPSCKFDYFIVHLLGHENIAHSVVLFVFLNVLSQIGHLGRGFFLSRIILCIFNEKGLNQHSINTFFDISSPC